MKKITNEEIIEESRKIEKVLNDYFLVEFSKRHNISEKNNLFNLKQEVIAKKGYFSDVKKKYALHITNEEGVEKDKLFIKGLITQRSDYPSVTKERFMTLIEMLVKTEKPNFKEIRKFIDDTRMEITKLCKNHDATISRPVSFSKKISEYKSIPYQVLAMQLWNECEYNYFSHGTKGKLFSIKGVDMSIAPKKVRDNYEKLQTSDYIVIPLEMEFLPEYYIVDVKKMVGFAWDERIIEFIRPIVNLIYQKEALDNSIVTF